MLIKTQAINREQKLKPRDRHKDSRKTGGSVGLPRTAAHGVQSPAQRPQAGPQSFPVLRLLAVHVLLHLCQRSRKQAENPDNSIQT